MSSDIQMLLARIVGLVILVLLITKTKVHVFLALILVAIGMGLVGGMSVTDVMNSVTTGFGKTLSSIGIIIGFGVMFGKLLEIFGATNVMASTFLFWFGKKHEAEAMAVSGFITSLSIFCTSGYIILSPLNKALSKQSGRSIVTLAIALATGLVASHSLVPPAAGPIGVAGILGVDIGTLMLYGSILSVPVIIVGVLYGSWLGKRFVSSSCSRWNVDARASGSRCRGARGSDKRI